MNMTPVEYSKSVADLGTHTPLRTELFSITRSLFGKLSKIVCWCPPPRVSVPSYEEPWICPLSVITARTGWFFE